MAWCGGRSLVSDTVYARDMTSSTPPTPAAPSASGFQFQPLALPASVTPSIARNWPVKRLVFLAGEASGDHLGAAILSALAQAQAEYQIRLEVAGTGGEAMAAQGCLSLLPLSRFNHMGFTNVLLNLPKLMRAISTVKRAVVAAAPDAVIGIDAQGYVGQIMQGVGAGSTRRIQLVAPTVWAAHPERAAKVAGYLDRLLCLYPFEPPLFERHGLRADFVGHPLVQADVPEAPGMFRKGQSLLDSRMLVALLPGSRPVEVDHMIPVFAKAIHQLSASMKQEITVAIPVAPLVKERVRALAKRWLPNAILVEGQSAKWKLFHDADLALCCAGTAVIELALAKTPIILGFRHDRLTNWLGQRVWRGFASIVNINANQLIHPEFLLGECRSGPIAAAARFLLENTDRRQRIAAQQYEHILKMGIRGPEGQWQSPAKVAATRILEDLIDGIPAQAVIEQKASV